MNKDCFVDMSHPMYGYNTQDKNETIIISITEDIKPCVRWTSNKANEVLVGGYTHYDRKDVPNDLINCEPIKCLNTGTFNIVSQNGQVGVKYQVRSNSDDFAKGFNLFYVKAPRAGKYTLKVVVSDFYDEGQKDAYVYTYNLDVAVPGHLLRTVDFTDTGAMTQIGKGWIPSDYGITISYYITYEDDKSVTNEIGLSSFMIVNDRTELKKFSNVLLSCLTSFTHNISVPATDARCFGRQYDPTQIEISKEITATTTSCNDYWLNPLQTKTNTLTSGIPITDEFKVKEITIENKKYGSFVIPDLYYKDCNTITISSDLCDCTYLGRVPMSPSVKLLEDEFIVLTEEQYGKNRGTVLISDYYVGKKVLVTYNGEREVELIVANDKRLNKTHFRVTQPIINTRGIKEYLIFNNVLITENSREFSTEGEITLSLTLTISRDSNGNFYELRRNMEDLG